QQKNSPRRQSGTERTGMQGEALRFRRNRQGNPSHQGAGALASWFALASWRPAGDRGAAPHTPSPFLSLSLCLCGFLLLAATPAVADPQSATQRLRTLEREIRTMREQDARLARESDASRREIAELRGQAIAAAALAQELESRIAEDRATIATLQQRLAQL